MRHDERDPVPRGNILLASGFSADPETARPSAHSCPGDRRRSGPHGPRKPFRHQRFRSCADDVGAPGRTGEASEAGKPAETGEPGQAGGASPERSTSPAPNGVTNTPSPSPATNSRVTSPPPSAAPPRGPPGKGETPPPVRPAGRVADRPNGAPLAPRQSGARRRNGQCQRGGQASRKDGAGRANGAAGHSASPRACHREPAPVRPPLPRASRPGPRCWATTIQPVGPAGGSAAGQARRRGGRAAGPAAPPRPSRAPQRYSLAAGGVCAGPGHPGAGRAAAFRCAEP